MVASHLSKICLLNEFEKLELTEQCLPGLVGPSRYDLQEINLQLILYSTSLQQYCATSRQLHLYILGKKMRPQKIMKKPKKIQILFCCLLCKLHQLRFLFQIVFLKSRAKNGDHCQYIYIDIQFFLFACTNNSFQTYCEPPNGTLSEAKSARRGELIGRVKILYICSDKITIGKKKSLSAFCAETASPVLTRI